MTSMIRLLCASVLAAATAAQAQSAAPAPAKAEVCAACHGPGGRSIQPQYPILAGQTARYLDLQLRDFQAGRRTNELMTPMVAGLTRDEMRELAAYFAKQTPPVQPFKPDADKARLGKLKASWRAGKDAMELLKRLYGQLRLRINQEKSAVARPWSRKFLGYSFWVAPGRTVKRRVAPKALGKMKQRVREITTRNGGRSMKSVFAELRSYLPGWKQYFQLAETPGIFRDLDEWIRHRLRMVQLKQWKRGKTIYREMRRLGANEKAARQVAANSRRWWRNSAMLLNTALPTSYYDRMGVPRLAS